MGGGTRVVVLGATGGCGARAVEALLERGADVTAVVRSAGRLPDGLRANPKLAVVETPGGHLGTDLREHLHGATAVLLCLGHNLTPAGLWGPPWRLCRDSVLQVARACRDLEPSAPIRLAVISTEGVSRPDGADPPRGLVERLVLGLLSLLIPPVADNEAVVATLGSEDFARKFHSVEFCAVRPSNMVDGERCAYSLHETLQNGALNATGQTTRANVGHFMADLATSDELWGLWRGKYPHILDVPA